MKRVLIMLVMTLMLTGCWDQVELESRDFVVTIGVDKDEEGGFTVFTVLPVLKAVNENRGENTKIVKSATAQTVKSAMSEIDATASTTMYYGHTKLIVLGEKLLEDVHALKEVLDALDLRNDISKSVYLTAHSGDLGKFLETDFKQTPLLGLFIANYYNKFTGKNPETFPLTLIMAIKQLEESEEVLIPQIDESDGDVIVSGAVALSSGALRGWVEGDSLRGLIWLNGGGTDAIIATEYEGYNVSVKISENHIKRHYSVSDGVLVAKYDMRIECAIEEFTLDEAIASQDILLAIEKQLSDSINNDINTTVKTFQTIGMDGVHLINSVRKHAYSVYEQLGDDLAKAFANASVIPNAQIHIRNTGGRK